MAQRGDTTLYGGFNMEREIPTKEFFIWRYEEIHKERTQLETALKELYDEYHLVCEQNEKMRAGNEEMFQKGRRIEIERYEKIVAEKDAQIAMLKGKGK